MSGSRDHIVTTSLALFLKKSYREVTMSEIVEKTGLSKGAFYHYFKSKEDLFREVGDMLLTMGQVDYSSFETDTLQHFIEQYIEVLNKPLVEVGNLVPEKEDMSLNFFLIMFEAATRFPDFMRKELEMHKRDLIIWKSVIGLARERGEISSQSSDEELAELFLYCNDGVFIRFLNSDRKSSFYDFLHRTYFTIYTNLK